MSLNRWDRELFFETCISVLIILVTGYRLASGAHSILDYVFFGMNGFALFIVLPCILLLPQRPTQQASM